jgi:hypothetical protein
MQTDNGEGSGFPGELLEVLVAPHIIIVKFQCVLNYLFKWLKSN